MITPEDKSKVQDRLDVFDQLLEEDEFVQQQRALGREEGRDEGKIEEAQQILINLVSRRFPTLTKLAQQKAKRTSQLSTLNETINSIADTFDEASARAILNSPPVA